MKSKTRMFNNSLLEFLSKSGPRMMSSFHLLLSGFIIYVGFSNTEISVTSALLIIMSGFFIWTFFEYILHRYLFHWEGKHKLIRGFHYVMHGHHHEHPNDADHLFMPPLPALMFLAVFFGLFYLILKEQAYFFLAGFELGYLVYSRIHYLIHVNSRNAYIQKMKHHHVLHHFRFEDKAFGVSTMFWDKVFNTMPEKLESRT